MKRSVKFTVLTVALTLMATTMFAGTAATVNNNNVTSNVQGGCQWSTPLTMAFGTYDPFSGSALTQTTSVGFNCVKKTNNTNTYKIWFSKTAGAMSDGTDSLNYTLTDGAGAGLPTTALASTAVAGTPGVGAGTGYTFTVKGSVAASQNVEVGSYADTVVANVEY